jgi:alpha-mannosidase
MKTTNRFFCLLFLLVAMLGSCVWISAAPRALWQIGKFDHSSMEFNQGSVGPPLFGLSYPKTPIVYIVGQSVPKKDWPAFQPGTSNGTAGYHPYPYTIQFDLKEPLKGVYSLKVGMVIQTQRLSILQIDINGHRGWAYQRPQWNDVPGDKYWNDTVKVELPVRFLRSGTNRLVLTAVDEPNQRDDASNPGIVYDALELDQDPQEKFDSGKITAQVQPTVFYQNKDNQLTEIVDVFVDHNAPSNQGRVVLAVAHQKFTQSLSPDRDFGEQRVEFAVPEFSSSTSAELTVTLRGHSRHFRKTLNPARKWTVLVVPHEHLDVGYTDYQAKVAEVQSRVLDEAMGMIQKNPDFRYSPDGYWVVQQFFAGRTASEQQKLLQTIQGKKIFIPAQYANLLTGFPTVETLIRSLYPSFRFDQQHGESFDYANITDVPSYSWSYASVLAAAGLKYFLAGCDQIRGPILNQSHLQEGSPFWWEGPDGGKVLMWYSDSYGQVGQFFGLPPRVMIGHDALPRFLQVYSTKEYKPSSVLLFGAQWENSDLFPQQATFVGAWNKVYAYPRLVYTDFGGALQAIVREAGSSIPVIRGDGGPYWEDGIVSDARFAAMSRESEQRALSAEKLSTLSSLLNPRVKPEQEILRQMWRNLILFDEHTWGAAGSVSNPRSQESIRQLAVKDAFATRARHDLEYILDRNLAVIAASIHDPSGTWVVFNPLNWQRSSLVEMDLPKGDEIVDLATQQAVPYEVLSTGDAYQHVRFMARDVPSVGYRCYALKKAASKPTAPQTSSAEVMENKYYRIVLDPESGAVKSIYDKELQKDLVDPSSAYRFDQYLYVTGGDQPSMNSLIYNYPGLPVPQLTVHGAAAGHLISVTREPFGTVARLESSATNTPRIDTEIVLFNGQKTIEFINRVHKNTVDTKEGVYFAFPFSMDHPQFRYEIQNGYVDPAHDQLPGAGKEWFSVQHWIEAQQEGTTVAIVPVDAPLVTLGDIVHGAWPLSFGRRKGTIFSYAMNNYWFTNYRADQGGDFTFRYIVTSGQNLSPDTLSRMGWSEMTPFEVNEIIPNDKAVSRPAPLNGVEGSFLKTSQPNVVLVNWKRAENNQGTILRFIETAGKETTVSVQIPHLEITSAWQCNAVEQNQKALSVSSDSLSFSVSPFQILTLRVEGAPKL